MDKDNKVQQVECLEYGITKCSSGAVNVKDNNPLSCLTTTELQDQALLFCDTYGFEDKFETFRKAALIAQKPMAFESLDSLTEDDKHWLRREITSTSHVHLCLLESEANNLDRWDLPWAMYMCVMIVSIGSAVQYDGPINL
jgi:hypothetical protein